MFLSKWKWSLVLFLFAAVAAFAQEDPDPRLLFTKQPATSIVVPKGQSATLSVEAQKGDEAVSYQWYKYTIVDGGKKDRVKIDGATSNTYTTEIFTTMAAFL